MGDRSDAAQPDEPRDGDRGTSGLDGLGIGEEPAPSRWPKVALWTGVGVVVLGGAYVGAQWALSDTVPTGTTVAGIDVGGQSSDEAQATLDAELAPRAREPLAVEVEDRTTSIDPQAAGLEVDTAATAASLTSFSLRPQRLWEQIVGGGEHDPVVTVDDDSLSAELEDAAASLDLAPVDGTVSFEGAEPQASPAQDGTAVDVDRASDVIADEWLVGVSPVPLPSGPTEPDVTQDETDAALAVAETVVSAPVTVEVGDQRPELPPAALAGAASFPAVDGDLVLTWDEDALDEAVLDRTKDLESDPTEARFVFADDKPTIKGGKAGAELDPAALTVAVDGAATSTSTDERTVAVELVPVEPESSADDLKELGVKKKIVEFSTPLTDEPVRTQNLRAAAKKVTGVLVRPGDEFSVSDTLAPITVENGYSVAHVVVDGFVKDEIGGGLSQMATSTYNAGFLAGFEDITHKPHSYYYDRYPEGRESTMYVGQIDVRWKNDSPYGALLQSWISGDRLYIAVWSSDYWDVSSSTGPRRDVVEPTTVTSDSDGCAPSGAGNAGFTVTVTRKVSHDGDVDKDEAKTWTYQPQNKIVCE
ncbi:vanomycin resistance protein VanB [Paraoerskovia sediminicola]|uniref:Vanomycin resistance protein VanB n=1 Tax=Paraoerskovia sediminicola TaxID=1138587 RepID=A0ABN6X896_9CELL|nr:VanW family protein [Paraoerskovia sediminicola]BDZ40946.1 vanomycin resistance protein VanB [Paraoerskovia sediminicola]